MEPPQQVPTTTRNETNFQQQPTISQVSAPMPMQTAQVSQVHNTNSPAGPLMHTGLKFCKNHRQYGTRCKYCQGGGCEWKQMFDPMAVYNPNLKPLQSYGEMMVERDRQNQQNPQGNQQYSNQQRPGMWDRVLFLGAHFPHMSTSHGWARSVPSKVRSS